MNLVDTLRAAADSLRANLLRTALTTLGIIIGVAAVIAMAGVGAGARERMDQMIQSLGSNVIVVLNGSSQSGGARGGSGSVISLTEGDAAAIAREVPGVDAAAGYVRGAGQVIFGNTNWYTSVEGITEDYMRARDWVIAEGRGFTAADERRATKVTIVGKTLADRLFGEGGQALGQSIRINRVPVTVVGVTADKGQTPWGRDQDDVAFLPLATAKKRVLGGDRYRGEYVSAITVKTVSADALSAVELDLTELLRRRHKIRSGQEDDFSVRNVTQMLSARYETQATMAALLAAVAGVSLIVGGIGIMNIMLVSVTERTREIGLRMAVGGRGRDILIQFVIEAVALSLIGGLIGVALGVAGSMLAAKFGGWTLIVSPAAVGMAIVFSAAIGIFFGYYPALKAARLNPIEALRHE